MMNHGPRLLRYTNLALISAVAILAAGAGAAIGCDATPNPDTTGGAAGNGGTGGGATTTTTGQGGGGGVGGALTVGSGGQSMGCDPGASSVDDDGDGYTEDQFDCDDCDPNANPGAAEVIAEADPLNPDKPIPKPADEDCDSLIDADDPDLAPCDLSDTIQLASTDPMDAVKAIGFCDTDKDGKTKFLKKATWTLADGLSPGVSVDMDKFHLGHGIFKTFGKDTPREGARMLALSSGTARTAADFGFVSRNFNKGYSSNPPLTFDGASPACPGVVVPKSSVQDAAGIELEIMTPTNALSLEFSFNFRSYEFPQFICTQFNDFFWANFVQGNVNKNISFDDQNNAISVNAAFLTQCECPPAGVNDCIAPPFPAVGQPQKTFNCTGKDLLEETDFDGNTNPQATYAGWTNAGSGWLKTTTPVEPNKLIKLRFVVFDSGVDANGKKDHNVDSTVFIDKFRWHAVPADLQTVAE